MNRGRRQDDIFLDDGDYRRFLEVLQETVKQWNLEVAAYCLMSNHYHILVRTPSGNISRCMRHLNGVYTQRFNQKHEIDGALFRGRYKSVLVEEDSHLLKLLRYIHRNPLKAGIVPHLDDYRWSSHKGYLAGSQGWNWLTRDPLLAMFTSNRKQAHIAYAGFVQQEDSNEVQSFFAKEKRPPIFGSVSFVEKIKNMFGREGRDSEIPEAGILHPAYADVLAAVCQVCHVSEQSIYASQRGQSNPARDLVIYSMRQHTQKTLEDIGKHLNIEKYSSVSSAVQRIKKQKEKDSQMRELIEKIDGFISKAKSRFDP